MEIRVSVLDKVEKKEIRDLLGKGWLTHDGMWFYHAFRELGIEKANTINKAAIRSLAPIEVKRTLKHLGINDQKIRTAGEIKNFMVDALELTLPSSVFEKINFSTSSNDLLHWEWENEECFAYKGMKRIGLIEEYRCGVMYRIECWFETLGINYTINPRIDKCIMSEKGMCRGDIRVLSE